jgi:hypothetical protein
MTLVRKIESDSDDIRTFKFFGELAEEVEFLARPSPCEPGTRKIYPDPARLSPIERRLLVRSVFSFIEAVVFTLKTTTLMFKKAENLSAGEVALAKEEDYELDDSGAVKIRSARLKFRSNFRFAFALAAKVGEIDWQLNVSDAGWQALTNALPVRDRLMHPKRAADLVVSDNEIRDAMKAYEWVFDQVGHFAASVLLQRRRQRSQERRR